MPGDKEQKGKEKEKEKKNSSKKCTIVLLVYYISSKIIVACYTEMTNILIQQIHWQKNQLHTSTNENFSCNLCVSFETRVTHNNGIIRTGTRKMCTKAEYLDFQFELFPFLFVKFDEQLLLAEIDITEERRTSV